MKRQRKDPPHTAQPVSPPLVPSSYSNFVPRRSLPFSRDWSAAARSRAPYVEPHTRRSRRGRSSAMFPLPSLKPSPSVVFFFFLLCSRTTQLPCHLGLAVDFFPSLPFLLFFPPARQESAKPPFPLRLPAFAKEYDVAPILFSSGHWPRSHLLSPILDSGPGWRTRTRRVRSSAPSALAPQISHSSFFSSLVSGSEFRWTPLLVVYSPPWRSRTLLLSCFRSYSF